MADWISANLASLLVGLLVFAAALAAVIKIMRDRKNGKGGCGGNCAGCAMRGACHKENPDNTTQQ
ncbi:MAG: FeoB-associated Cys-rich membrane protein [Oscillospiraceae bacterium]|nr:FeoB-associated Cys-rich membrane protein [Oscillospiraceae bacterium]